MTENDSIKITRAETLPDTYYAKKDDECSPAAHVKLVPCEDNQKLPQKEKVNYFDKFINPYISAGKELCKKYLKSAGQGLYAAADIVKENVVKLSGTALDGVRKMGLNAVVSASMLSLMLIFTVCFCSVAADVTIDGAKIGTISEKSDYENLISEINSEIMPYGETEFIPEGKLRFTPRLILKGDVTDRDEIKERLKATSSDMIPAYAVMVDGVPVFALASEEMAREVLSSYEAKYTNGEENAEVSFLNEVKISHRFVPKVMLKTTESGVSALAEGKHIHYTVKQGDTLESIALENNVSLEDIMLSNTIEGSENLEGSELDIYTGEPIINVKVTRRVNEVEAVACSTFTEKDTTKYIGTVEVKNEGKNGEKQVEAIVTTVNGVETERDIISETILSEPINRIEVVGTKEKPSPYGTGDFATPTSGQLSSRFGSRWGRQHKGIDLAASEGTPIYAADNGTVIYSQYNDGGFGYLIEIDHSNGYVTYYAHCSKLVAQKGDVVAKGDLIGYVGNTGNSTGAHLHFEVRKNGEPCDPLEFIAEN